MPCARNTDDEGLVALESGYADPDATLLPLPVSPLRRPPFCFGKKGGKTSAPGSGPACRRGSLAPALLRGPRRWAVPGPAALTRHPWLVSPCATPPLGLHKSRSASPALPVQERQSGDPSGGAPTAISPPYIHRQSRHRQPRRWCRPSGGGAAPEGGNPACRRGPTRSNGFGYFGRNQSDAP
jgi:hypothetical protein